MSRTQVVTYSAPNSFATLSLCAKHDADQRTRYTSDGQPFATVSHGRHYGTCDECEAEASRGVRIGKYRYLPTNDTPPEDVRFDVPGRFQGLIVETAFGTRGRSEADAGDPWLRVTDTSDGTRGYYRLVE